MGSPEFRLALSCALQSPKDPLRRHWLPLKERQLRFSTTGSTSQPGLDSRPESSSWKEDPAWMTPLPLYRRRVLEARQSPDHNFSMVPARGASAFPSDPGDLAGGRRES